MVSSSIHYMKSGSDMTTQLSQLIISYKNKYLCINTFETIIDLYVLISFARLLLLNLVSLNLINNKSRTKKI